ncbi:MAG TPA: hypothetical protein VFW73_11675 [Lacipirellulaceae bacterium]|nr:hypothetical protein [Lacipirellulaceae bacterium]
MPSGTLIIGSAIGYAVALLLELIGVRRRFAGHRIVLDIVALCAVVTHFIYLVRNILSSNALPVSTANWLLWAAWLIAAVYLAALYYLPRTPTGIVLLPIVLGLIVGSHWANTQPLASERSFYVWGIIHGLLLLVGTVAVCIGFLAGLMYLAQSYALKHARSSANRLRLPSLEWLERVNSRALGLSAILIALGFISGVVMSVVIHRGESAYVLWTDPVVLSLAAMLLWLVAAEVFRLVYPAARRGRKVAYLTLASFVFLVIALASFTLLDTVHTLPHNDKSKHPLRVSILPQHELRTPLSFT